MNAKIGNWGGSSAVRLPKKAMQDLGLVEGTEVDVSVKDGALIIRPAKPIYSLDQLLKEAEGLVPPSVDDDQPIGAEWPST